MLEWNAQPANSVDWFEPQKYAILHKLNLFRLVSRPVSPPIPLLYATLVCVWERQRESLCVYLHGPMEWWEVSDGYEVPLNGAEEYVNKQKDMVGDRREQIQGQLC